MVKNNELRLHELLGINPELSYLMNLPSALDPELVGEVLQVMKELPEEEGMTMVIVTH